VGKMGVATWRKCPMKKTEQMVWITNFEHCSESGKCMHNTCSYNRKDKTPNNAQKLPFLKEKGVISGTFGFQRKEGWTSK